jgi:hypothetical protein
MQQSAIAFVTGIFRLRSSVPACIAPLFSSPRVLGSRRAFLNSDVT